MSGFLLAFVAALLLGTLLTLGTLWLQRRQRRCPSCRVPLVGLAREASGEALTYEVLVCPSCTNALTLVHGTRARYAWCPECRQRTLETPCIRLPDADDGRRRVEVHENCHLCGHMAVREVGDPPTAPAKRGQVIPFPRRKRVGDE